MGRGPRKSGFPLLRGEEGQGSGVELSPQAEAEQSGLWPDEVGEEILFFACPAGDCFSACPAGAKTAFSFAPQKKKRFWTPKKKR